MTELEAIRERHSVRSYKKQKIESEKAEQLRDMIDRCNQEGNLHLQLIEEAGNTFNRMLNRLMGLGSAPSVIACVGPDDETLDERIGYYGQKVVLYAQMLGLNTCWAGTFNEKNVQAERRDGDRLPIVIAIGYGTTGGKKRKSKTPSEVAAGGLEDKPEWFRRGLEAALLAPTAVNQQKFEVVLKENGEYDIVDKGGILSRIDLGIVRYNFEVGARG